MRTYTNLNDGWFFTKDIQKKTPTAVSSGFTPVTLPHTWNCTDGQDGGGDYHRGQCWYVKELPAVSAAGGSRIYLEFQAASAYCEVYLNGTKITEHAGGYSIFRADITDSLTGKGDILSVMVSNEARSDIYPQMADFTFYGGLYRDVNLICVPETHLDLDYHGAPGVTVTSSLSEDYKKAAVTFHAYVTNPQEGDTVSFTILDNNYQPLAEVFRPAAADTCAEITLSQPHLWQGVQDPYLYYIDVQLIRHNEVLDDYQTSHGIRTFYVDPQKGFFLNGQLTPLRGVSRHQDRLGLGNALTIEEHLEDAALIHELGANTIRLAHYQHSQDFYDACDEYGFIVWAEIPFISSMNPDPAAHQNCISQMTELIFQNYNHSCICFWGISNEITIGGSSPQLVENLKDLNALVHRLDPTRLTTMAQVSTLPMDDVQNEITDVLSYNHYFGWYGGSVTDNEKWLDAFHAMHPDRALGISEYGCEAVISYHSDDPKPGDYSEEYQALYHEHMAKVIAERPWLWATHIWNMFDFGCDARSEGGVSGRNNKGLMTIDRRIKKDSYYLYQAYWTTTPVLHICSKRYARRAQDTITVKVYSNQPEVSLFVDGEPFASRQGEYVFVFPHVPLKDGVTTITAAAGDCTDSASFERAEQAYAPYTYVDEEDTGTVTNWFDTVDLEEEQPLTFHEGYFSIKDTINDIVDNAEAGNLLVNALRSATGMHMKKSMLKIMGGSSVEALAGMMPAKGDLDPQKLLASINAHLQKIRK